MARTSEPYNTTNFEKVLTVFPTQVAIAKICKVTESNVSVWRALGRIPTKHAITLHKAAKGRLEFTDLRKDIFSRMKN